MTRKIDGIRHDYRRRDIVQARVHNPFHERDGQFQRAVYDEARRRLDECAGVWHRNGDTEHPLLLDWGCGSGRKLVERFGPHESIGVDLPPVVERLQMLWPDRVWLPSTHPIAKSVRCDVLVCADVIEHVARPDALMDVLTGMLPAYVIISTPAREFVQGGSVDGPPTNPAHLREWTFAEFALWVSQWLVIEEHRMVDEANATQCVVGRPRTDLAEE